MATALHKDLPDSELHEPKGVSTAASGEVYVSDGVGSGTWQAPPAGPVGQHDLGGSEHNADTLANLNAKITDATLDDSGDPRDPNAHASSHENGGSDEIDVTGLSGVLADEQNADQLRGRDVHDAAPTNNQVLTWISGNSRWEPTDPPGSSGGEANTASNQGVGGVGVFDQKAGLDLQFKNINAGSSKVTVTDDAANTEIDIDIDPGEIDHQDLNGAGTNTHATIDTHLGSTSNPHSTSVSNLGSGTLAQLNANITDATLDDSGDPRTPTAHATTHENGGSDEIDVGGLSGVLADKQDADKIQGRDVQDATPNDGDVLVWDDGLSRWQPEPQGASANVFGLDYQTATSIGRSTTTSATFVTKVTLTTPALTGTYRVGWTAVVDMDSLADSVEARLYNSTDAAQIGATNRHEPKDTNNLIHVGGFAEVVFTGVSKSISIEYRDQGGGTAGIQDARIEIWRVS